MVMPMFVTEEEFAYLEDCLMSVDASKVTDPIEEIRLELLGRALDSKRGDYLHPLSGIEKQVVESLLQRRKQ